jgi:transposase
MIGICSSPYSAAVPMQQRYLRKNLVHGARAVLPKLAERDTPIGRWLRDLLARQHKNVVVVALANKLAHICWAVLSGDRGFAEEVAEMH